MTTELGLVIGCVAAASVLPAAEQRLVSVQKSSSDWK
jgi:hypothetical protein